MTKATITPSFGLGVVIGTIIVANVFAVVIIASFLSPWMWAVYAFAILGALAAVRHRRSHA